MKRTTRGAIYALIIILGLIVAGPAVAQTQQPPEYKEVLAAVYAEVNK
ncbi:MAG: hypothetical protein NTU60_02520 [Candidatus Aminicenantes bacterium]|nr:hypothetical protein [Candidatus Aminicenantes bacterium]